MPNRRTERLGEILIALGSSGTAVSSLGALANRLDLVAYGIAGSALLFGGYVLKYGLRASPACATAATWSGRPTDA